MNKYIQTIKRALCLLLACLVLLPALPAKSESPSEIRVLLRRLNLADRTDLTMTGRYLVRAASGTELMLADGAKVTVLLQDGQLLLFTGGVSTALGKSVSFLRQDSGETVPGIRFNLQAGFYPGSLALSIDNSGEAPKLQPILTIPLETYLMGVVPYEMGDGFPAEALKAQAVCARTYALSHMNAKAAWDVVDTTNDQVFRGLSANSPKSEQAVRDTAGLVLTCDGKLITAWYSASNGGQTELPSPLLRHDGRPLGCGKPGRHRPHLHDEPGRNGSLPRLCEAAAGSRPGGSPDPRRRSGGGCFHRLQADRPGAGLSALRVSQPPDDEAYRYL